MYDNTLQPTIQSVKISFLWRLPVTNVDQTNSHECSRSFMLFCYEVNNECTFYILYTQLRGDSYDSIKVWEGNQLVEIRKIFQWRRYETR